MPRDRGGRIESASEGPQRSSALRAFGFSGRPEVPVSKLSTGVDDVVHRLWTTPISLSAYSIGWGNSPGTCEVG